MSNPTAAAAAAAATATASEDVVQRTLGIYLVGVLLMSILYGVTLMQTLDYYRSFPKDRMTLKLFVAFLTCLDTASTVLLMQETWVRVVQGWGTTTAWDALLVTDMINVQITAVISFAVQSFLISRVWTLSRGNIYLVAFLMSFTLASLVLDVIYGVRQTRIERVSLLNSIEAIEDISLALVVATDFLITACLSFYFHRSRTSFSRTNSVLDMLTRYAVGTGFLSSACAVCDMIAFTASPTSDWFYAFFMLIPKLYVNNCLATLNVRKIIRADDHAVANTNNHPLSGLRWASTGRSSPMPVSGGGTLDTYVIPTTESDIADGPKAAAGLMTATLPHDV